MNEEALKQFNKLNEHDKKEVMNLIRFKNEYKYQQLQQRIDKAIEYILNRQEVETGNYNLNGKELLKILKGDK